MEETMGKMEKRLAELLWERAPLPMREVVALCEAEFVWNRSTTYTMCTRLMRRGLFAREGGVLRALMTREEYQAQQGARFVEENFAGSLPRFLTAFVRGRGLSREEAEEIERLIRDYREE